MQQAWVSRTSRLLARRDKSFFLHLLPRPFSVFVGGSTSPPLIFLKWLSRLSSELMIFEKVFLLCTSVQQFPFSWTWHMFTCKFSFQSPILIGRIYLPIHWVPHVGVSCLALQEEPFWRHTTRWSKEENCWYRLVVQKGAWKAWREVYALRASLCASDWKVHS